MSFVLYIYILCIYDTRMLSFHWVILNSDFLHEIYIEVIQPYLIAYLCCSHSVWQPEFVFLWALPQQWRRWRWGEPLCVVWPEGPEGPLQPYYLVKGALGPVILDLTLVSPVPLVRKLSALPQFPLLRWEGQSRLGFRIVALRPTMWDSFGQ